MNGAYFCCTIKIKVVNTDSKYKLILMEQLIVSCLMDIIMSDVFQQFKMYGAIGNNIEL